MREAISRLIRRDTYKTFFLKHYRFEELDILVRAEEVEIEYANADEREFKILV